MPQDPSDLFEYVRRTYFPRWDRARRWRVQYVDDLPSMGLCDMSTKTISFRNFKDIEADNGSILLIHEICHAPPGCGGSHGKAWRARMLKAADVALSRGDLTISDGLRKEIEEYSKTPITRAFNIYAQIENWVFDRPDVPYEMMIEAVARSFGLYGHELEHYFKRCRRVYEKAQTEAGKWREAGRHIEERQGAPGGGRA